MSSYIVVIPYREPTYELRRGGPPEKPYLGRFEIEATSEEEAIDKAIQRFEQTRRESSVGWVREFRLGDIRVRSAE